VTRKTFEEKVKANRLLMIDEAIRSGTYPGTARLARLTEVNARTIQRDIEFLRDMYGAPIAYDHARKGYYYTEPNFFVKSIVLTEGEMFALALFDQLLEQYRDTPLEENLREIFGKIIQALPNTITVDTLFLNSRVSFIPDHPGSIDRGVFKAVFSALKERKTLAFDYRPLQKTTYMRRTIDPYHAICQRGNWYVIGHCHDKNEPRMFSFSRIRKAAVTKKAFTIPEDFNPHEYFDKQMGVWASKRAAFTVELLVENEIGTYALERRWHETQEVTQREDGKVLVKFSTTQMQEVLRWVLGQGHTVKVLGPPELVGMVREEAKKIDAMYQ
jgi:predicted DNA-binding transcriptional regulator YafY